MADFLREGGITRLSRLDDGRVACCVCFGYVPREGLEPVEVPSVRRSRTRDGY